MKSRTEDDKVERDFHRPPTADPDQGRVYYPGLDGLRAFWVRRALRIWPLYYLVVAIGFGIYPWLGSGTTPTAWRASYGGQLPAFLGLLGNWSMIQRGQIPDPISVLWSVCVEEQFYLFVPLLVGFLVPRWRVLALAALIGASVVGRYPQVETPVDEDPLAADRPIPGRVRRRSPRWRIARQSPRSIVDRSPERAGSDSRDLRTARFW